MAAGLHPAKNAMGSHGGDRVGRIRKLVLGMLSFDTEQKNEQQSEM